MKHISRFLIFLTIFLFSCTEEINHHDEVNFIPNTTRNANKSTSENSFYDFDYVANHFGVGLKDTFDLQYSRQVLRLITRNPVRDIIQFEFPSLYGYPAWSLSRADMKSGKDYLTVLTPIYKIDEQISNSTLVTKVGFDGKIKTLFLYDHKKFTDAQWAVFEPYHNELTSPVDGGSADGGGGSVFSRNNPCKVANCNGWCMVSEGQCVYLDGGVFKYCGIPCGGSGNGGDETIDGPLVTNIYEGGSASSGSSVFLGFGYINSFPPLINPNETYWSEFSGAFSWVSGNEIDENDPFPFPEDGFTSSDIYDPLYGTINLMDPYALYLLQLTGFIDHYGLSASFEDIDAMLPDICKGLLSPDFYNCARYSLVNELVTSHNLQLTSKEKWFLFNNFEQYEAISSFLANQDSDAASASASIYLGLADAQYLDLSYEQAHNSLYAGKIALIIKNKLEGLGMDDHASMDPSSWYLLIKKEVNRIGGNVLDAYLEASERAFNEFWNKIITPLKTTMAPVLASIGDQFPSNPEEWQAMMAVFGPMLLELGLDIGTDFIPIVGEVKSFTKAGLALSDGNYADAVIEFLGGVAGIIPIWDLVVGAGKVIKASAYIFTAFKVIKAIAKYSNTIFSKLIEYAQKGWKIAWDGGLKKLTFKTDQGVLMGEIDKDGIPNILNNLFKSIIDVDAIKSLNPKTLIDGPKTNVILKEFIENNANRFNITDGPLADDLADIIANGDPTGTKTEYLMNELFKDAGYTLYDGSYGPIDIFGRGMNGFDGVYIKGPLDNPTEIIINESKQFNANNANYVYLTGAKGQNPAQMTDAWVDKVVAKLKAEGKVNTANAIQKAKDNGVLTKIVTVVDATPNSNANGLKGGVSIIKVE